MKILNRNTRTEYHLITCDHPFLVDAGLSSFTLPQIMAWWSKTDYRGVYVNQILFKDNEQSTSEYSPITDLLKWSYSTFDDTFSYVINSWRYEAYNKGIYVSYMLNGIVPDLYGNTRTWEYYNNNPEARVEETGSYDFDFLNLDEFDNKVFDRGTRTLVDPPISLEGLIFTKLIAMNDKYNVLGYQDVDEDRARRLLINDIKKSKNSGYVPWTSSTTMYLNVQEGSERCPSLETFNFKLYLYNKKKPLNTEKGVAFPLLNIAAPAIGADGVNNLRKEDGDSDPVVDDSPNNKVAGQLRTSFRPHDGTFSAGSEVRLAIIAVDTPAATLPGGAAEWAEGMDIEQHLRNPDSSTITPGIGEVISIDMQNANPFQWTPNYSEPRGCRSGSTEKVRLKVWNFNPKEFKRGDFVEIVDQYSLWCVKPLAEQEEVLIPQEVANWQFTYHITNQRYHFRYSDYNIEGTGDSGFHENKLVTSEFQMEEDVALKNLHAKNSFLWAVHKLSAEANGTLDDGTAWPGYAQITSFDYLGKEFAGLRGDKGNALVLTDNRKDHTGEGFEYYDDPSNNIGTYTTPFFGCVFSEGYSDDDKYNNLNGPVFDPENLELLTGQGWRPGAIITKTDSNEDQSDINQNELFFDRDMFVGENPTYGINGTGFTPALNPDDTNASEEKHGLFQPKAVHNNISTNYSPAYFLDSTTIDSINEALGHVNLFSSEAQLLHLPADIGTNGSWDAQNGGPILNLNKVQQYITNPETINYQKDHKDVANSFHDFWLDPASNQWLYDTIDRTSRNTYSGTDRSALDFKPKNNKRVLFRPLKDTVYCQWDQKQDGTEPFPVKELSELGFSNYEFTAPTGKIGLTNIGGGASLFGVKTKNRIVENDTIGVDSRHLIVDRWNNDGLYNDVDLGYTLPFEYIMYLNNELDKLDDLEYKVESYTLSMNSTLYYGNNLPDANGANDFNGSIEASMGGFGVIGARCTAIVTTGIQFNTSNYLGQPFFFNVATQGFDASWGAKQQLKFNQTGTTQLFVKVYQAWPRDQTIFDSRFFAVHHFNEGNKFPISDGKRPWEKGYRFGNEKTIELGIDDESTTVSYDETTQTATGIDLRHSELGTSYRSKDFFVIDKLATNVDVRIPSYFNEINFDLVNSFTNGIRSVNDGDLGKFVFKEGFVLDNGVRNYNHRVVSNSEIVDHSTYVRENFDDFNFYSDAYSKFQPLAPKEMWVVDPDRRARLLPWYQTQHTLGFGDIKFLPVPSSINGVLTLDNTPFTEPQAEAHNKKTLLDIISEQGAANVIVQNPGSGYQLLDKFEVQGGDGSSAEAIVTGTGNKGSVTGLFWNEADTTLIGSFTVREKYNGKNYSQDNFPEGLQTGITTSSRSSLSFVPTSGDNRSFRAYLMCGSIIETTNIDFKPKIASEIEEAYVLGADNNSQKSVGSEASRSSHDFQVIPFATPVAWGGPASTNYNKPQLSTDPVFADKQTLMALNLNRENSNPNTIDGQVDLFFQFHNDITHTKQRYVGSAAYENFIDLNVTPY